MTRDFTLTDNCTGFMLSNNRVGINVRNYQLSSHSLSDSSYKLKRELLYRCTKCRRKKIFCKNLKTLC